MLAVGEDITGARELLWTQTVDVGGIRDFDYFVAFHDVATHAGNAGIGLVVHEKVATVVGAIGE